MANIFNEQCTSLREQVLKGERSRQKWATQEEPDQEIENKR